MPIQITILGLGQIGTSIGLALAEKKDTITRVGNDREPGVAKQAQRLGAVDKVQLNLPNAVRNADVVILSTPVDEIRHILEAIQLDLKEGCVVIDTSPVKIGVAAWVQELLPKGVHFVTMTPTLNPIYLEETAVGVEAAHADLFKNSLMVITSPPGIDADALKLAADLATLLGGTPFFADPYEVDGLLAAVGLLPRLMAAALVESTTSQPGWNEARKLASRVYAQVSHPLLELDEVDYYGQAALLNKDNVVRMLDEVIQSLRELRSAIATEDEAALKERIGKAIKARNLWLEQRYKSDWDRAPAQAMPTAGEMLGSLVGLGKKREKKQ